MSVEIPSDASFNQLQSRKHTSSDAENLFIRYVNYSGDKSAWRDKITEQIQKLMYDIDVSKEVASGRLRYFEVESEKYLPTEAFEKKFLDLKSKMKRFKEN